MVLFNHAATVEGSSRPVGSSSEGLSYREDWAEDSYSIFKKEAQNYSSGGLNLEDLAWDEPIQNNPKLKFVSDSLKIHKVQEITYKCEEHRASVRR